MLEGVCKMTAKVYAVIISYRPTSAFINNIYKLVRQFPFVILVDNTPIAFLDHNLMNFSYDNLYIIKNGKNVGVAKALNQGIGYAEKLGAEWVVTFDQDTVISNVFLQEILHECKKELECEDIGVIGVNYLNENNQQLGLQLPSHPPLRELTDVITSGCITSIKGFKAIGGFQNELFIDMVDCEYCFRLRKNGYRVLIYTKHLMSHSLGNLEVITILGRNINLFNHSPFRRYFIFRNTIYMLKKYFLFDTKWCLRVIIFNYLPKLFIKACLLEKRKKENFKWIIKGIRDGIFSRYNNSFMENGK